MQSISKSTLVRLPTYLTYLRTIPDAQYVSATGIAQALGQNPVQVRKDLACVSSSGRPKVGYVREELIREIERFLGFDDVSDAVLVGAGRLGRALLGYKGFTEYGLNILAAFDEKAGPDGTDGDKPVLPMNRLAPFCKRLGVRIGIIAVPADAAQPVCDHLIEAGILAIWNFAPVKLSVPGDVLVQNENMASSLAILSTHLAQKLSGRDL